MKKVIFFLTLIVAIIGFGCGQSRHKKPVSVRHGDEAGNVYDTTTFTTAYPVSLVKHLQLEVEGEDTAILSLEKLIAIKENYGMRNRYLYFTGSDIDSSLISVKVLPKGYCLSIKALTQKNVEAFPPGTVISFSIEKIVIHQGG